MDRDDEQAKAELLRRLAADPCDTAALGPHDPAVHVNLGNALLADAWQRTVAWSGTYLH